MTDTFLFSTTDQSIDIVGAIFFALALFYAIAFLWENHITHQGRIILSFIIVLSGLHIFQVCMQFLDGSFAPFRVWDFVNYLTGVLFLMLVFRVTKKEKL